MKWNQVKRNWPSVSDDIKCKWGKFTDEDLLMISGQREEFVRLFEQRYGGDQASSQFNVDGFVDELQPRPQLNGRFGWIRRCWANLRLRHIQVPNRR